MYEAYRTLGIEASCSDLELKTAYRRLLLQNHPDKVGQDGNAKCQQIIDAYKLICIGRNSIWAEDDFTQFYTARSQCRRDLGRARRALDRLMREVGDMKVQAELGQMSVVVQRTRYR